VRENNFDKFHLFVR